MNVKPGDLAIIINVYYCTENIGRIVEVIRRAVPGVDVSYADSEKVSWLVRSDRLMGRSTGGRNRKRLAPAFEAPCADEHLRPVSGLPAHDEVKDELHA